MFRYKTAYFCANSRLNTQVATPMVNGELTLGLLITLETGEIKDVSVSLNSELARSLVKEYFLNKNVIKDSEQIKDEITMRHRGSATKALLKVFSDIQQDYIAYRNAYDK